MLELFPLAGAIGVVVCFFFSLLLSLLFLFFLLVAAVVDDGGSGGSMCRAGISHELALTAGMCGYSVPGP